MSRVCEPLNPTEAHGLQPWVSHEVFPKAQDEDNGRIKADNFKKPQCRLYQCNLQPSAERLNPKLDAQVEFLCLPPCELTGGFGKIHSARQSCKKGKRQNEDSHIK